jgi:hypothetical protein
VAPLIVVAVAAIIISIAALAIAARVMVRVQRIDTAARQSAQAARRLQLLRLFAPGVTAAAEDPRALLTWQPFASTARNLFPDDFADLDRAAGATFPFSREQIEAAHARWSTDWLAWERMHDGEYKLKAAAADEELRASPGSSVLRARVESVEREKLERYQRRYEEYTRVSKALRNLI